MGAVFSVPLARADDVAPLPGATVALVAEAAARPWTSSSSTT